MSDPEQAARARVAALAGRRFDAKNFPTSEVDRVERGLGALFDKEHVTLLVCAAACGADLVALRLARSRGLPRRIVLPFAVEAFRARSVADRCDPTWSELFDELVKEARSTNDLVILELAEDDTEAFTKTNEQILEIASSAYRGDVPLAIVVWEGAPRAEGDVTADFQTRAIAKNMQLEVVLTRPPVPPGAG